MPLPHNALVLVADGRKMLFFRNTGDEQQIDLRTEAHDARAEVMPLTFLKALARAYSEPRAVDARKWLARYDIVVVGRASHPVLRQALSEASEWQLFAEDPATSAFRLVRAR